MAVLSCHMFSLAITLTLISGLFVDGCNMETKAVGVCLHVYLERDFLPLEGIVYPKRNADSRTINNYGNVGALRQPAPLPDVDSNILHTPTNQESYSGRNKSMASRHRYNFYAYGETTGIRKRRAPENFVVDSYGTHGWVEGPELEDYCSRLGTVITCFEEILITCDNGHDFFRYRHLLHSLAHVHRYLCQTPEDRSSKFLPFLKLIDCAETTRERRASCHRPNITLNVWNQILRLEVGPEICDSLNTQRSCLLDNHYMKEDCDVEKEELYKNVSGLFLGIWCRLPLYQHFYSSASTSHYSLILNFNLIYLLLVQMILVSKLW